MTAALLTKQEVADLAGRSARWVEQQRDALKPVAGQVGRNGRPVPLYDVAAMAPDVQKLWAGSQRSKVIEIAPAAADDKQLALALTVPVGPNLSVEDRLEADRRFGVIEPLVDRAKYGLLWAQFPRMSGMLGYLAQTHGTPGRTIYRWLAAWESGGLPALVRRDRCDKGTPRVMNDAARVLLLKLAVPEPRSYGALRVREMWRLYEEERAWRDTRLGRPLGEAERGKYAHYLDADDKLMPAAQLPQVSYETFRTWFNRIPEMVRVMARDGNEKFRNTQDIISHRDIAAVAPMDYVVMDHRLLDIFCLVRERGGWRLQRPWLTAAIDMRTRKWLGWCIVETPSSDSIATVLKRVFLNYGLPANLYWDNGKDFRCEWFEGRARKERQAGPVTELDTTWRGVLGTLGIRVHHAIVRNARAKLIEPNFQRISNIDRQLPEWCGHKPGARPERFDELLRGHEKWLAGESSAPAFRTIEEIASLYSRAIHAVNEQELEGDGMRKTTNTGHGWMCPNEAWELEIGKVGRRDVPADVLHMCFAKRKALKVQHGEVTTNHLGRDYHYRLQDNTVRLMKYNGCTVDFAYDPLDLGEGALYYEDRFLGLVSCVELRRMGEEAFVQDEQDRRAARRENKKAIQVAHTLAYVPTLDERLSRRAEVTPARAADVRVEMQVALPEAVVEAAAAARIRGDEAPVTVEKVAAPVVDAADDGTFDFFA